MQPTDQTSDLGGGAGVRRAVLQHQRVRLRRRLGGLGLPRALLLPLPLLLPLLRQPLRLSHQVRNHKLLICCKPLVCIITILVRCLTCGLCCKPEEDGRGQHEMVTTREV